MIWDSAANAPDPRIIPGRADGFMPPHERPRKSGTARQSGESAKMLAARETARARATRLALPQSC
jgi:hypothetical protein